MPVTLRGLNVSPDSDTLNAATSIVMPSVASIGAGVTSVTIQTSTMAPFNYKIRKIAVFLTAIDNVTGGNSFNLVVGGIAGVTGAYSQNNAAPNDNSQTYNSALAATTGSSLGYPTNVATAGMTVFANDVPFNSANTYGTATGAYVPGYGGLTGNAPLYTGWSALTTGGGYGIFVPTNYDAVYPCNLPISLRVSTIASTGSISNISVRMGIVYMPLRKGPSPGQNEYGLPGLEY